MISTNVTLHVEALKRNVLELLTSKGSKTELLLGYRKPAVIMMVGVNGEGKTTSLGKLAYRLKNEGAKILMAAGDTFRAATSDQLEIWGERTPLCICKGKAAYNIPPPYLRIAKSLRAMGYEGKELGFDIVLCDTSVRKYKNFSLPVFCLNQLPKYISIGFHVMLMEEFISCKRPVAKVVPGVPNEILLVLDGTTGLNMLPQAREFNDQAYYNQMNGQSQLCLVFRDNDVFHSTHVSTPINV
ncbi:Cell division protein FtsY, chloroplastic [Glycine soja]